MMKYEQSTWNKYFGQAEYKVTFENGRVIQTAGYKDTKAKHEIIPTVIKRMEKKRGKA